MKKMNLLTRFLIMCSGADRATLEQCTSVEIRRATLIGTCVLIPALLGTFSGTYAALSFDGTLPVSIMLGCLWGFIIFLIDRAVVAFTRPREFNLGLIGRVILACVFALIISVPLELRIFRDKIDERLAGELTPKLEANNAKYDAQISVLQDKITNEKDRVQQLNDEYIGELDGTSGSRVPYRGPIAKAKEKVWQREDSAFQIFIGQLQHQIDSLNVLRVAEAGNLSKDHARGFLGQIVALGRLEDSDPTVAFWVWVVRIFFFSIELVPLLIKLGASNDAYYTLADEQSAQIIDDMRNGISLQKILRDERAEAERQKHTLQIQQELQQDKNRVAELHRSVLLANQQSKMKYERERTEQYMNQLIEVLKQKNAQVERVNAIEDSSLRVQLLAEIDRTYHELLQLLQALISNRGHWGFDAASTAN